MGNNNNFNGMTLDEGWDETLAKIKQESQKIKNANSKKKTKKAALILDVQELEDLIERNAKKNISFN